MHAYQDCFYVTTRVFSNVHSITASFFYGAASHIHASSFHWDGAPVFNVADSDSPGGTFSDAASTRGVRTSGGPYECFIATIITYTLVTNLTGCDILLVHLG